MAQATHKIPNRVPLTTHMARGLREGAMWLLFSLALYLLLSLWTYHASDPGWSHTGSGASIQNSGGIVGAWFADIFLYLFGLLAYLFPIMITFSGWLIYQGRTPTGEFDWKTFALRWLGFGLTLAAGSGLATLHFDPSSQWVPLTGGGVLGNLTGENLRDAVSFIGATLFLFAIFLVGVTLFTGLSWLALMDWIGKLTLSLYGRLTVYSHSLRERLNARKARIERELLVSKEQKKIEQRKPPVIQAPVLRVETSERAEKERQVPLFEVSGNTELPPLALLDAPAPHTEGYSTASLEAMSRLLEIKMQDFGVEAQVVEVNPGPVITRFEIQPGVGVKSSQISNLAKDLARALSVMSVRVVEIIPGKSVIGIEIPNEHREIVTLSEILHSKEYDRAHSALTLTLGKDISGLPVVADLAKMPHLLVAGTTGSGKSVAINAMILSLLYKATPQEVRLIMIDPKMLELSVYEGIPHLLTPVVTDMKEAANALRWCVGEMDRRYRLMAALGVRNIGGYNKKVKDAIDAGEGIPDPLFNPEEVLEENPVAPTLEPLPFIVVIVDELADMMMIVGKKVEQLIARLAQKARASGVHLILATQRPSVDVLTGLIKANVPTRIAFQVSSKIDSRTILDQMGAEQLLGQGDMLFMPPGTSVPNRVHGAFVDDHEVHAVVDQLRSQHKPNYLDEILDEPSSGSFDSFGGSSADSSAESDPLYDQAVHFVTQTRRASISGVQRRLKIGYNRAARMVEQMEEAGIVSAPEGAGNREVLAPPPPSD